MIWSKSDTGCIVVNMPDRSTVLRDIARRLDRREGFSVATLNLDHVVKLRDPAFRTAYAEQTHVTADGNPIVWLSRLAGQDISLVPGSELVDPVAALAAEKSVPVAFFGATQASLQAAADALVKTHQDLNVVLTLAPSMDFDPDGDEADEAIARLRASGARLVYLALGAPRQERFAARAQKRLPETGFLSIGAGLDFVSGAQSRAPRWVRAVAAEWLWRLILNPRRLGARYGACMAVLPGLTLRALGSAAVMSGTGNVAVIIVNYGTADLVVQAVESVLARRHGGREVEIHVVDNASPGDDADTLAEAHAARGWGAKDVTLWPETENHGFGRGNNVVFRALADRASPPEFVLLLNSDAWLENETIDILARALEADPKAGGAGAGILHEDGKPAVAAFRFPTMSSEFSRVVGFGPIERLFGKSRVPLPPDHDGPVDWVAGASVMFRFTALQDVDFFDPIFFLYFEEVDMMRRMRQSGWRILYVTEALVTHVAGASTTVRSQDTSGRRRPEYVYQSWRYYFVRQHGRAYALVTALLVALSGTINITLAKLRRKPSGLPDGFLKDHWTHVVRPLLSERPLQNGATDGT